MMLGRKGNKINEKRERASSGTVGQIVQKMPPNAKYLKKIAKFLTGGRLELDLSWVKVRQTKIRPNSELDQT